MNKGPNFHVLKVTLNDTHTFLAGGKDINQDTIPTAMIYDWSTDTWTFLESMLSPRVLYGSCGAVTDPNTGDIHVSLTSFQVKQHIFQWSQFKVVAISGVDAPLHFSTEIYSVADNTWSEGPMYPEPIVGMQAFIFVALSMFYY